MPLQLFGRSSSAPPELPQGVLVMAAPIQVHATASMLQSLLMGSNYAGCPYEDIYDGPHASQVHLSLSALPKLRSLLTCTG